MRAMTENTTCCATKIAELEATIQRLERDNAILDFNVSSALKERDSLKQERDAWWKQERDAWWKDRDANLARIFQLEKENHVLKQERAEADKDIAHLIEERDTAMKERDELRDLLTTPMPAPVELEAADFGMFTNRQVALALALFHYSQRPVADIIAEAEQFKAWLEGGA